MGSRPIVARIDRSPHASVPDRFRPIGVIGNDSGQDLSMDEGWGLAASGWSA
jgi:hypothetical protein